jgi:hypothetical protein
MTAGPMEVYATRAVLATARRRALTLALALTAVVLATSGTPIAAAANNGGATAPSTSDATPSSVATPKPLRDGAPHETGLEMIQHALGVHADGEWGPVTLRALRRFQATHGLAVNGVSNAATLTALGLDPSYEPPLPPLTAPAPDAMRGPSTAVHAELHKIAMCESGNSLTELSYGGLYRGRYQFDMESWYRAGGLIDPAQAPAAEQYNRAAWILATQGRSGAWPVCS